MLTANLVRVRFHRDRIIPRYVDPGNPDLLAAAEQLLDFFRSANGWLRGELAAELDEIPRNPADQFLQQGLVKLLEDRSEFEVVSGVQPETIRECVFGRAASARKDGNFERSTVLTAAANELQAPVAEIESGLFADLKSEQHLVKFENLTAERLLHRYNLALAQGVLLKAVRVEVEIRRETPVRLRALIRKIKFHRLICSVTATSAQSCRISLDGPLSLFSATQRYGVQLASFLPGVVPCRDFELHAELRWGPERKPKTFRLESADGLIADGHETGAFVPADLAMFARQFRAKMKDWRLLDETVLLPLGDSFWAPDFRIEHIPSGRSLYLEVLGFWRRSSAERHLERLRSHATAPFILAVSDSLKLDDSDLENLPAEIVRFRQMPLPDEVVRRAAAALAVEAK